MFSAMLLAISIVALGQFAVFYWRAVVAGIAAQPVSEQVLAAARVESDAIRGDDFRSFAKLHDLTPDLSPRPGGLGFVPVYFKFIHAIGILAAGRVSAVANWAESERALCARYAAVQIDRRLQSNMALAAAMRSC
jgi:hypothetical protein